MSTQSNIKTNIKLFSGIYFIGLFYRFLKSNMSANYTLPINFSYKGDSHFIDVNTLVLTQTHFLNALVEINRSFDSSVKLNIKIEAVKQGSFELNQLVVVAAATELFSPPTIGYIDNLFSILSSYLSLHSFLKGEKADKIEPITEANNEPKVVIEIKGKNIKVHPNAINLYMTNNVLSHSVMKMGEALVSDNDVDGLELKEIKSNKPLLSVSKSNFSDMVIPNAYLDNDTKIEEKKGVTVIITKPEIDPKKYSRWNFIYNGRRINSVIIKDNVFLKKVKDGIYRFGNGDGLRVNLNIVYKMDINFKVFIENRFEIIEVIEPIFVSQQSKMY